MTDGLPAATGEAPRDKHLARWAAIAGIVAIPLALAMILFGDGWLNPDPPPPGATPTVHVQISHAPDPKPRPTPEPTPTPTPERAVETVEPTPTPDHGDLPKRFAGTWVGLVDETGGCSRCPYPVRLELDGGYVGETVGRIDYTTFRCSGDLTLVEASRTRLTVTETITERGGNCTSTGTLFLTYRAEGKIGYRWGRTSDTATGTLSRSAR